MKCLTNIMQKRWTKFVVSADCIENVTSVFNTLILHNILDELS